MMIIVYVLGGIIALFFLLQLGMRLKMRMQKGKPAPELGGRYGKAVKSGKKAMFYFYSESCSACKPMTPIIEQFVKKNHNYFKVNIAKDMQTARQFGVMGTPSTVIIENGKIQDFLVGPQPEQKLRTLLN